VWVTETQSDAGWIITLSGYGDLEPKFEGARHHTFCFIRSSIFAPSARVSGSAFPMTDLIFP